MSTRILSVIALTTLLGACASTSPSAPLSAQSLQHHHWVLEKIDGPDGSDARAQAESLAGTVEDGDPIFRATPRAGAVPRAAEPETEAESTGLLGWLSKRFFERGNGEGGGHG